MPIPVLSDTETAAAKLHISHRTLENWRANHKGPDYVKIGKRAFYSDEALEAFIRRNTVSTSPDVKGAQPSHVG